MNRMQSRVINTFILAIVLLSLVFSVPNVVSAQETADEPPSSGLQEDLFLTGDNITIDGAVDGDVIAIGRNIAINGPISGSLVALGREISITDQVSGSAYIGGFTLELGELSEIG